MALRWRHLSGRKKTALKEIRRATVERARKWVERTDRKEKAGTIFRGWRRCVFVGAAGRARRDRFFFALSFSLCLRLFRVSFSLQAGTLKKAHPVIPPFDLSLPLSSLLSLAPTTPSSSAVVVAILLVRPKEHRECENEMEEVPRMRNVFVNSLLMR